MPDTAPLIFRKHLGGLYPNCAAAEKAMAAIDGTTRVVFKRTRGNRGRMALYWIVLAKVAPLLSDMCDGDAIDENMLHRILKDRRGLYSETTLPSGEIVKNYDSISFHKMTEDERNGFIQWAFDTLSKWLEIDVATLTREASGQGG